MIDVINSQIEAAAKRALDTKFSYADNKEGFSDKQVERIAKAIAAAIEVYDQQKQEEIADNKEN